MYTLYQKNCKVILRKTERVTQFQLCNSYTLYIGRGKKYFSKKAKIFVFLLKYTFLKERGDGIEYGRTNQRQKELAGNQRILQRGQTSAKELSSDYSWA